MLYNKCFSFTLPVKTSDIDKVLVEGLNDNYTRIRATKGTLRIDRFYSLRSRGSLNALINSIVQIKLIEKGYLPIHASCLSKNGKAVLLAAFPNVGKTLSAHQLLKSGFKYISDDTVIVSRNGTAYLTAFPSAAGYYDFLRFIKPRDIGMLKYAYYYAKSWLMHKSKLLNRLLKPPHINLADIYETEERAEVKVVCSLEIGPKTVEEVEPEFMMKKIKAINEYSLPRFYSNPFIKVYDYFNPGYVEKIKKKEDENLLSFLSRCECYCLSCDDWDWKSMLKRIGVI